jgi:hypothetical protein
MHRLPHLLPDMPTSTSDICQECLLCYEKHLRAASCHRISTELNRNCLVQIKALEKYCSYHQEIKCDSHVKLRFRSEGKRKNETQFPLPGPNIFFYQRSWMQIAPPFCHGIASANTTAAFWHYHLCSPMRCSFLLIPGAAVFGLSVFDRTACSADVLELRLQRRLEAYRTPPCPWPWPPHCVFAPPRNEDPKDFCSRLTAGGADECAAFMLWRAAARCAWDSGRCCLLRPGLALLRLLDKDASLYNIFQ